MVRILAKFFFILGILLIGSVFYLEYKFVRVNQQEISSANSEIKKLETLISIKANLAYNFDNKIFYAINILLKPELTNNERNKLVRKILDLDISDITGTYSQDILIDDLLKFQQENNKLNKAEIDETYIHIANLHDQLAIYYFNYEHLKLLQLLLFMIGLIFLLNQYIFFLW